MTIDRPDFQVATNPSMPGIGTGQIAWFQSDTDLVDAGGSSDLINYEVPDNMELHVCSGVVSCGLPRLQRYDLRSTPPAYWISPTSHIDPDGKWSYEEKAYDGDSKTSAQSYVAGKTWSSYLTLLINERYTDKVRFWAFSQVGVTDLIDIDVYYEGDWHDVYEGDFANLEWVEKDIPAGVKLISKAKVRFYNDVYSIATKYLHEFQFKTYGPTPQAGIYFDTHAIIPYLSEAPYLVEAGATFAVRVYNDDAAAQNMSVSLAGFLQAKV